jgi:hypothetical protein
MVQGLHGPKLIAFDLDLTQAASLLYLTLNKAELRGALTINPLLRELNLLDTPVRSLAAPQAKFGLRKTNMTGTGLGGPVPEWLLNAPELEELSISNNNFSSMPKTWRGDKLRVLRASANSLPVRSPALGGCNIFRGCLGSMRAERSSRFNTFCMVSQGCCGFQASTGHDFLKVDASRNRPLDQILR